MGFGLDKILSDSGSTSNMMTCSRPCDATSVNFDLSCLHRFDSTLTVLKNLKSTSLKGLLRMYHALDLDTIKKHVVIPNPIDICWRSFSSKTVRTICRMNRNTFRHIHLQPCFTSRHVRSTKPGECKFTESSMI